METPSNITLKCAVSVQQEDKFEVENCIASSLSMLSLESHSSGYTLHTSNSSDDEGSELEYGQDGCYIFVGDLAKGISEETIEKAFAQYGDVSSVQIKRDKQTGKNLGYGFVRMSCKDEAFTAKRMLNHTEIGGRRVRLGWAQKNTSLYVGGVDDSLTLESFVEVFGQFGPLELESTFLRGRFGFVKYRFRIHAEHAKRELNGCHVWGIPLKVEWNNTSANIGRPCTVHFILETSAHNTETTLRTVSSGQIRKLFEPLPEFSGITEIKEKNWSEDGIQFKRLYGAAYFNKNRDGERAAVIAVETLQGQHFYGFLMECSLNPSIQIPRSDLHNQQQRQVLGFLPNPVSHPHLHEVSHQLHEVPHIYPTPPGPEAFECSYQAFQQHKEVYPPFHAQPFCQLPNFEPHNFPYEACRQHQNYQSDSYPPAEFYNCFMPCPPNQYPHTPMIELRHVPQYRLEDKLIPPRIRKQTLAPW